MVNLYQNILLHRYANHTYTAVISPPDGNDQRPRDVDGGGGKVGIASCDLFAQRSIQQSYPCNECSSGLTTAPLSSCLSTYLPVACSLSLSLSACVSVCVSVCLFVCLSVG